MRSPIPRSRGVTLVEMLMFGGIGIAVMLTMVGFLTQGTRLLGVGRRTSATQGALRVLLRVMAEDAGELVHLENSGKDFDSSQDPALTFVIDSNRTEPGLTATEESGLRRVSYRLVGSGALKSVERRVEKLSGQPGSSTRTLAREAIRSLKVFFVSAYRNSGSGQPRYRLTRGTTAEAKRPGSTPVCLVVDVEAGEGVGFEETEIERAPITSIVTKLWCRNRVLELARGGLR